MGFGGQGGGGPNKITGKGGDHVEYFSKTLKWY